MHFLDMITALGLFAAGAYTITTLARLYVQWRISSKGRGPDVAALEERLARVEASVEGVSAETQRLADGHRFFTQLLTDRRASLASGTPAASGDRNGRP